MMKHALAATVVVLLAFGAPNARAADWYVDGAAGNDANPGTAAQPVQTIARGLHLPTPGDTLHIEPTAIYTAASGSVPAYLAISGTVAGPITIQGDAINGNKPQIVGVNALGVEIPAGESFLRVTGLDVTVRGSSPYTLADESCVYVFDGSNHIRIDHLAAHGCGDNGIASRGADYLTVDHNDVWGNATDTATFCDSGIELYQFRNTDALPGFHNLVEYNRVWDNTNYLYGGAGGCPTTANGVTTRSDTDGNGIIVDDSRNTQNNSAAGPYAGATLIEGNLVWGNGGRGIYCFISDHCAIINNTVYGNITDPLLASYASGEIECLQSGDCSVRNNIAVTDGKSTSGGHFALTFWGCSGLPVVANNNLLWALTGAPASASYVPTAQYDTVHGNTGAAYVGFGSGPANRFADPMLVNPTGGAGFSDFHLHYLSPAARWSQASVAETVDLDGNPAGPVPNSGAYQVTEP